MKSPHLISTQAAFFFDDTINRPDKLFNKINSDIGELIDSMPETINLPPIAPADIPRVVGHSSNGEYELSVSLNRVDIKKQYADPLLDQGSIEKFRAICKLIILSVSSDMGISRIGLVSNLYIESSNPSLEISRKYLKKEDPNLLEINLRTNKESKEFGLSFNNIILIQMGNVQSPSYNGKAIIVQVDTNTIETGGRKQKDIITDIFIKKSSIYNPATILERIQ
ncbi:hypothetical protein [Klebsiella pneumoniae]|uniref:hypothetical protein n=1 Tax=Klebsiella pneumoniae TaxID=573 RepID=UPI001F037461|nr:hypothetical protein [Klebsiella pneumoniae]